MWRELNIVTTRKTLGHHQRACVCSPATHHFGKSDEHNIVGVSIWTLTSLDCSSYNVSDIKQNAIFHVCIGSPKGNYQSSGLPNTTCNLLRPQVQYPACWDGKNLDSPDRSSHVRLSSSCIPCCVEISSANRNGLSTSRLTDRKTDVLSQREYSRKYIRHWHVPIDPPDCHHQSAVRGPIRY